TRLAGTGRIFPDRVVVGAILALEWIAEGVVGPASGVGRIRLEAAVLGRGEELVAVVARVVVGLVAVLVHVEDEGLHPEAGTLQAGLVGPLRAADVLRVGPVGIADDAVQPRIAVGRVGVAGG